MSRRRFKLINQGSGGGGATTLGSLTDVDLTGQLQFDLLYNADGTEYQPTAGGLFYQPSADVSDGLGITGPRLTIGAAGSEAGLLIEADNNAGRLRLFTFANSAFLDSNNIFNMQANAGVHVINATAFRAGYISNVDSLSLEAVSGGKRISTEPSGGFLELIANNGSANVRLSFGTGLEIRDSSNIDTIILSHDGVDANLACGGTTDLNITGISDLVLPEGTGIRPDTASSSLGFQMRRVELADDASTSFTVGLYAHIRVVTNFNRTADIDQSFTSTQAPEGGFIGSAASVGTGANPDVDGNSNYWKSDTTTFNIRNRLGTTRAFNVYIFNGV